MLKCVENFVKYRQQTHLEKWLRAVVIAFVVNISPKIPIFFVFYISVGQNGF